MLSANLANISDTLMRDVRAAVSKKNPKIDTDCIMMSVIHFSGDCWWWLRSPGCLSNVASLVKNDGTLDIVRADVNDAKYAACPVMWIIVG